MDCERQLAWTEQEILLLHFKETSFKVEIALSLVFSFILLIHEGSHKEVYQEFQPSYDIFHR